MKVVRQPNELRVFYYLLYASIILALFLMAITIAQKLVPFSRAAYAFVDLGRSSLSAVEDNMGQIAHFPLLSAIIAELFGLKHYATLFNVGHLAGPIGSYLLNVKVAGFLHDQEALAEKNMQRSSVTVMELTCI
ncbi:hypothetical protein RJ639_003599, partial [Escallonia herrerae]